MSRIQLLDHHFRAAVEDLLELPELASSRDRIHHFDLTEYDHLVDVARHAHRISRFVRADARVCARAGLLHDLGAHWFNTAAPCLLAERLQETHGVRHAIRAHTLFPVLPRTREAWVVVAADFITSAQECRLVLGRARSSAGTRLRIQIGRSNRFITPLRTFAARRRAAAGALPGRRQPIARFGGMSGPIR